MRVLLACMMIVAGGMNAAAQDKFVFSAGGMCMHQQLFLLCARKAAAPAPALPYDAEVEWLEGTGTQYVDTGVELKSYLLVSCRFKYESVNGINYFPWWLSHGRITCGSYVGSDGTWYAAAVAGSRAIGGGSPDLDWHTVAVYAAPGENGKYIDLDGVRQFTWSTATAANFDGKTVKPFAGHIGINNPVPGIGKISAFSVFDAATDQMLIDLVAVRKDGVGYMYDKVSGELFGNAGTGSFGIGPDK